MEYFLKLMEYFLKLMEYFLKLVEYLQKPRRNAFICPKIWWFLFIVVSLWLKIRNCNINLFL